MNRNDKLEGVGRLDGIREGASLKHADRLVLNKRQIGEGGSQLWRVEGMALEEGHEREGGGTIRRGL